MKVFVTGTDTGVGKTIVSAWLCLHFGAYYWKPVQSGTESVDSATVKSLANLPQDKIISETYVFKSPVSPHLAAAMEGRHINMNEFILPKIDRLVVEGAGGVLVPLNGDAMIIDLIRKLDLAVIVVTRSTLGTINHTCLTVSALKVRNISVLGVIMNGPINVLNKEAIEQYCDISVLDQLAPFESVDYSLLKNRIPSKNLTSVINEFNEVR